ncbi:hypothetical protein ACTFIR_002891 [Dictyostelium discoideum]
MGSKAFSKGELEVINNSVKKGWDVKKTVRELKNKCKSQRTENVVKEAIDEFKKNHSDLDFLISDEELISSSDESSVESTPKKRINRGKCYAVLNTPEIERKVRDATSNDKWGPSGTQMQEISRASYN